MPEKKPIEKAKAFVNRMEAEGKMNEQDRMEFWGVYQSCAEESLKIAGRSALKDRRPPDPNGGK